MDPTKPGAGNKARQGAGHRATAARVQPPTALLHLLLQRLGRRQEELAPAASCRVCTVSKRIRSPLLRTLMQRRIATGLTCSPATVGRR